MSIIRILFFTVVQILLLPLFIVGSSMIIGRAFWDIAVLRGCKYFANGDDWKDESDPKIAYQKMYFLNDEDISLKTTIVDKESNVTLQVFEYPSYESVKEWGKMMGWNKQKPLSELFPIKLILDP